MLVVIQLPLEVRAAPSLRVSRGWFEQESFWNIFHTKLHLIRSD